MKTEMDEKRINELLEMEVKVKKYEAISKKAYERRNARIKLTLEKAKEANIIVTDTEIDEYIKTHPTKKKSKK